MMHPLQATPFLVDQDHGFSCLEKLSELLAIVRFYVLRLYNILFKLIHYTLFIDIVFPVTAKTDPFNTLIYINNLVSVTEIAETTEHKHKEKEIA